VSQFLICGALATGDRIVERGWVAVRGDRIAALGDERLPRERIELVDLGDRLIAPGFVDVHVHGGNGGQAAGADPDRVAQDVRRAARFHAGRGTTTLLATTVSDTPDRLAAAVAGIRQAMDAADPAGATVAGIHLEGPWLSPRRAGAHDPAALRAPDPEELAALIGASGDAIRLITLAPELDGAHGLIAAATAAGIRVSVGHTEAGFAQTRAAFDAGARHLTHLGNAMRGIDRREPGPIAAALADERITVEVIADGHHVHAGLLALAAATAPDRLVAITDATAAAGLPDGPQRLGRSAVELHDGRVTLSDRPGTLAGSALTMDRAVATLVAAGLDPNVAIRSATTTPAQRVLGDPARGRLARGARADLVVLDSDLRATATLIAGRVVHDPAGQLSRISSRS
jgi:N-acetylglucosamine-6-phosphate deacetylase